MAKQLEKHWLMVCLAGLFENVMAERLQFVRPPLKKHKTAPCLEGTNPASYQPSGMVVEGWWFGLLAVVESTMNSSVDQRSQIWDPLSDRWRLAQTGLWNRTIIPNTTATEQLKEKKNSSVEMVQLKSRSDWKSVWGLQRAEQKWMSTNHCELIGPTLSLLSLLRVDAAVGKFNWAANIEDQSKAQKCEKT